MSRPPLPPIRISLNLEQVCPLTQTNTLKTATTPKKIGNQSKRSLNPPPYAESKTDQQRNNNDCLSMECFSNDAVLLRGLVSQRFGIENKMIQSNFASAFVSQCEYYEEEKPLQVPTVTTRSNKIKPVQNIRVPPPKNHSKPNTAKLASRDFRR